MTLLPGPNQANRKPAHGSRRIRWGIGLSSLRISADAWPRSSFPMTTVHQGLRSAVPLSAYCLEDADVLPMSGVVDGALDGDQAVQIDPVRRGSPVVSCDPS